MTDKLQTANRKISLDILRVAATCAVVLLHTVSGVKDTTDLSQHPTVLCKLQAILDLVTWCVPVFVMISGYLFLNPSRQFTWRQMIFKYCRRIVLVLLLFGVPYACMELAAVERAVNASTLKRAVGMVLRGKSWSHMWYLYMVFFLYLATPVLKWVLKKIPCFVVYLLLAVLFLGCSVFPYVNKYYQAQLMPAQLLPVLPDDLIYLFYYLCGYLFVRNACDKGEKEKAGIPGWVILTLIVLLAAGMGAGRVLNLMQIQMAYEYPFTVVLSILIFAWAAGCDRSPGVEEYGQGMHEKVSGGLSETARARWIGASDLCFAIYLIHPLFINISYKFLNLTPWNYPLGVSFPAFWLTFLVLSAITAWVMNQVPVLRKYVL